MDQPRIAIIVEGHGEVQSVPALIRRIGYDMDPPLYPRVENPIRKSKSSLVHAEGELEKWVEVAARRVAGRGGILILIDSDADCPKELGEDMLRRARASRSDLPISVVVAKREFEAWFIAAAKSLEGKAGMLDQVDPPEDAEVIRDAKGWIRRHMRTGVYQETVDQAKLASLFDLSQARSCRSFRKFHEVTKLLIQAANLGGHM